MIRHGLVVCLCAASCIAPPRWASAQPAVGTDPRAALAHAAFVRSYVCVDPSDALARPWLQDEPCKLPTYQLSRSAAATFDPQARGETHPLGTPAPGGGHAMFWRFPVQVYGPYGAPRHGWR